MKTPDNAETTTIYTLFEHLKIMTPKSIPVEAHAPPQHLILRALTLFRVHVGGRKGTP